MIYFSRLTFHGLRVKEIVTLLHDFLTDATVLDTFDHAGRVLKHQVALAACAKPLMKGL
jgi:hypothetical protein